MSGIITDNVGRAGGLVKAATSSSGLTFISSTDISSAATYDFTAFTAGSFEHYLFVLQNLIPVTDEVHVWCRTSSDGGSSFDDGASNYIGNAVGGTAAADENTTLSKFPATGTNASSAAKIGSTSTESGASGTIYLFGPHTTSFTHMKSSISFCAANGSARHARGSGSREEAADVDGFRIMFSSGNIESGTITAYGLANA
jgi:hypothetical protein